MGFQNCFLFIRQQFIHLGLASVGFGLLTSSAVAQAIPCDEPYAIVRGDTLGAISERAYGGGKLRLLYQLNVDVVGPNPDAIDIGMVLQVPCSLGSTTTAAAPVEEVKTTAAAQAPAATGSGDSGTNIQADFSAAPKPDAKSAESQPQSVPEGTDVLLVFNKASAPKFIINVGIIDPYLAKITEVTEGRVRFVDPPVTNREARAQLDLVVSNEIDGAYVFNGYLGNSHPLLQLPMQPLMGGTAEQTAVALWRLHENYLSKSDYFDDAKLLGFIGAPAAHIWRLREAPVVPGEDLVKSNEYTVPYFDGLDTRGAPAVREENASWLATFDENRGNPLTFAMAHGAARAGGIWNDKRSVTEIENGVYTPTFSVVLSNSAWARIAPDRSGSDHCNFGRGFGVQVRQLGRV